MQQWLIEDLEQKLQTVFAALIPGARLHSAPPGPAEDGGSWMWWQQTFDIALDAALSVGLSAAAVPESGRQSNRAGY